MTSFLNPILGGILEFFFDMSGSYGFAVIMLSLFVMVITLPLNLKQMQFTRTMQLLTPETDALKKKYNKKEDKEKLNQATMELWQKHKVNPAMGCLPLLIQFPVLIAMFNVLQTPGLFQANPMWLGLDLTLPNPKLLIEGTQNAATIWNLPIYYWILPILSVVTTYLQSKQTMQSNDQSSKTMLYTMPIFMGYITISFPTALALYWVSRNVFTIAQQDLYGRFFSPQKIVGEAVSDDQRGKNRKDS